MDSSKRFRLRGNNMPKPAEAEPTPTTPLVAARDPVVQGIADILANDQSRETLLGLFQSVPRDAHFDPRTGAMASDFMRELYGVPDDTNLAETMRRERLGRRGWRLRGSTLERLQDYVFNDITLVEYMQAVHSRNASQFSYRVTSEPFAYAFACALLATGVDSRQWRGQVIAITMGAVQRSSLYNRPEYAADFYPILRDLSDLGLAGTRL